MEVRTDSNNVYYNFNNTNRKDDRIKLDNEPIVSNQNQENQTSIQTNTTNVTQLPRTELAPDEVRARFSDQLSTQINQGIINTATQNSSDVDFSSQSVELSLRDINQLQRQLNRGEVLENIASISQSERAENISEIDPEELRSLREENQELTQEELAALYFNKQAQESREQQAEIYLNNIENNEVDDTSEVSYEDINDLQTILNRTEVLDNIASTPQSERVERPSFESRDDSINSEEVPDAIIDQEELRERVLEQAEQERASTEETVT